MSVLKIFCVFIFIVYHLYPLLIEAMYVRNTKVRYKGYRTLWKTYPSNHTQILRRQGSPTKMTSTNGTTSDCNLFGGNWTCSPKTTTPTTTTTTPTTTPGCYKIYIFGVTHCLPFPTNSETTTKRKTTTTKKRTTSRTRNTITTTRTRRPRRPSPTTTTAMPPSYHGASCYACGLNLPGIPRMPGCHNAFSKFSLSPLSMTAFKRHCYNGTKELWKQSSEKTKRWYGKLYRGGCFKRFTDVGVEYDERGCREMKPITGHSFASKRYAYLEKSLYNVDNGCTFSPMASLTPFSRSISLYVRYHVCVCTGRYCNRAAPGTHSKIDIAYLVSLLLFNLYFVGY